MKIKICGLTRKQDIEVVNIHKPNYIGFVFAVSRRMVTPAQAHELREILHADIIPVGVFVDEPQQNILSLAKSGIIDVIQLHGEEDEEYVQNLKQLTDKPIIKAVSVQNIGDVQKWHITAADYLLLDHVGGGTGQKFDWSLIGKTDKPYFLAGGLNAENIAEAIAKTASFAVDVSSGVETNGLKDPAKIGEFIKRCKCGK